MFAIAVLWVSLSRIAEVRRDVDTVTISATLTSSGTVVWGVQEIPVASMKGELETAAQQLKSHGWSSPVLRIDTYDNTSADDVKRLAALGKQAGFDEIELHAMNWSDPRGAEKRP